ncbi:ALQxL family class IV lanthipeptide [Streptosporangium sp. NPDC006013]
MTGQLMELDIKALDLLPAQTESQLAACEVTCLVTCSGVTSMHSIIN